MWCSSLTNIIGNTCEIKRIDQVTKEQYLSKISGGNNHQIYEYDYINVFQVSFIKLNYFFNLSLIFNTSDLCVYFKNKRISSCHTNNFLIEGNFQRKNYQSNIHCTCKKAKICFDHFNTGLMYDIVYTYFDPLIIVTIPSLLRKYVMILVIHLHI